MPVQKIITSDGKRIQQMLAQNVTVEFGFLGSKAEAPHPDAGGMTVVEVASKHEFGVPEEHIPQRSMIGDYVDLREEEIFNDFAQGFMAALDGKVSYEQAMNAVAAVHVGGMQARIAEGIPPELAPFTIEMRRRTGRGSLDPKDTLIVTGQTRSSMSWLVHFESAPSDSGGSN
jgi:hypothetical protein